ncbi:MAG: hypothetical protein IH963_04840 [Chloroflexi bacterium]|nr:hypothetical protein [Chloroflexota bacterium]
MFYQQWRPINISSRRLCCGCKIQEIATDIAWPQDNEVSLGYPGQNIHDISGFLFETPCIGKDRRDLRHAFQLSGTGLFRFRQLIIGGVQVAGLKYVSD